MKRHNEIYFGIIFVMLGIGLICALVFPSKFLVVFLSCLLIISGILLCKMA